MPRHHATGDLEYSPQVPGHNNRQLGSRLHLGEEYVDILHGSTRGGDYSSATHVAPPSIELGNIPRTPYNYEAYPRITSKTTICPAGS
ncbi:hypothetical protein TWF225_002195 [Orbilia oligospora]|nr:hypothetical protein TWF225_002195 [Orbilia oligospora]